MKKRIARTKKKIAGIYIEISKGLENNTMSKELMKIKIEEANIYINELENFTEAEFL